MTEQKVLEILEKVGAVITNSHIVYTSGKHGTAYVNKDAVYPHGKETSALCQAIAEHFAQYPIDVVVAPALGGIMLSQWTAHHLSALTGREILGIYAQKDERSIFKCDGEEPCEVSINYVARLFPMKFIIQPGEELLVTSGNFVIRRGYDKDCVGKNVLVVEDVLTTGGSAKKVINVTRQLGGKVVGLGVLCNRGSVTPADVADPQELFALVNVKLDAWDEATCPLCAKGVPINTDVGKGLEYLARQQTK
ncbi:MAG: hypothetical protein A3E37_02320 [Candidatus Andersenbacteria bacterium RIFCSPHIGHO2_12_FULL_46_9]|nr:MAG: Orotate phosphoribosyltransferase [Parcubacteria group bacterium GW2011_GWA2_45_14]OGY34584.1 MAG: hypothetical protein A3B76_06355 [Candidatus Andersenbacteria bacterium RIFCSPHIGHO2_02_FULL_46_16]OGY36376.1 MAG: hypothetical protein A3E37_02320 [Candidatus Andersenbacteria bacterium RIFCSPHIGHO2_12_FULL_46_9]OGY37869.1 MAG: hypothetical protein A3I08_01610 [Candidatus Andersenbacteria bacterium RIFCSPLOWO2_02_FULL_46_11]HBE90253.1 phosphoribosyltransferase [Candidatus Andersenbacteria